MALRQINAGAFTSIYRSFWVPITALHPRRTHMVPKIMCWVIGARPYTRQGEAAQMTEQQHRPDLPWLDRQDIMLMLIVTILALVFVAAACWIAFR